MHHLPLARRGRRAVAAAAVAGIAAALLAPVAAQAAVAPGAGVLINEVYGGGGNNGAAFSRDFVEIVNTTSDDASLDGWSVQYASATGSAWQVTPLGDIALPAGETLVVGQAYGADTTLPDVGADVSGSIALSATQGKVALVSSATALSGASGMASAATVVDYVGWGAASDFAGTAAAPTTSNAVSVARDADGTNTADNGADFTTGAPTPEPLGGSTPPPTPEPTPTPTDTPVASATIAEIQGTGATSPLVDQTVTTTGVVTARYPTGGLDGYVIQTPGTGGAVDVSADRASDAIFVYSTATVSEVALGDTVQVTGRVTEFYGLTEITVGAGGAQVVADAEPVTPAVVGWPATDAERESLESMLVAPDGDFTVADTYDTNVYGEVVLASGTTPLRQPTDVALPGSAEAEAVAADNAARRVTLDDGTTANFSTAKSLTPAYVSLVEPIRVGAAVSFAEPHIVDFRNDAWKLNPTTPLVGDGSGVDGVLFENTRTAAPEDVGGDVSVASFNVLNYFTTLGVDDASCTAYTDRDGDGVTVRGGCDQRGAWDAEDFQRQEARIVAAIEGLDASVVGLMEIESSARLGEEADEAVATLVDALNASAGTERWAYVASPANLPDASELDVISSALIYQPAVVAPEGASAALDTTDAEIDAFQNAREPIAQTFVPAGGGEAFTVVVNHFKSKGSAGPWPGDEDSGDGQGASTQSRVHQAEALAEWVETDPTGTGAEAVLLVGDFNSYTQEDPMQVLYEAGYVGVESELGVSESSYVYDGLSGSLDHVLLNAAAAELATGADIWPINSGEAIALEYSRYNSHGTLFYEPNAYRSSDHDPVIVGLDAASDAVPVETETKLGVEYSWSLRHGLTRSLTATVTADSAEAPSGTVEFVVRGEVVGTAEVDDGRATLRLPTSVGRGLHRLTASFVPDTMAFLPSSSRARTVFFW
ncbi:ExeM/NucH family extracellular endonuclease [Microbacterium betulae]|uniref:ExeM/NucH family extracellular endonuclease n=1 Tax=Microbacterium betulae TaxID=2981139 RepID=A0AA97I6B9_9MICO|nr:ExeM/NucH family extracellular endonuclease [Microbacterium sp. AB]WOF24661.1 ExeM/NucH family extracellular endonuclease [Microbacterium sp. AB]